MAQRGNQRRKSFVVFGIILLIAAFAGIATFVFFSRVSDTVRVFVVTNPEGIQAYERIEASDIGEAYVQADTVAMMGGEKYEFIYIYDLKAGDGGLSEIVGKYAVVPMAYGEPVLRFKVANAEEGSYKAGLYEVPGTKLLTFQVPLVNALSGQLSPGDYIDVMSYSKAEGKAIGVLMGVQVIDIKYGSNPFSDAAGSGGEGADSEAAVSRNPLSNTVNEDIGDRAIVIISVPGGIVGDITPYLINSGDLYLVATTPPGVTGSNEATATPVPSDASDDETAPASGD